MYRYIFILSTLIFCLLNVHGQTLPDNAPFVRMTNENGLSNLTVKAIAQDNDGYMWFGTDDGLNRFDGYEIKVYRTSIYDEKSLSSNNIYALLPAKEGGLWIGCLDGGLVKYNPETDNFTNYTHDPFDPTSISSNMVTNICEARDGTLWIATFGGGLNRFDPVTEQFTSFRYKEGENSISSDNVISVLEDDEGKIWIRTLEDIEVFDIKNNEFTRLNTDRINSSLTSYHSYSMFIDSDGYIWATVNFFLLKINTSTLEHDYIEFQKAYFQENRLSLISVRPMNDEYIWIGHSVGALQFNKKTHKLAIFYHKQDELSSMLPGACISLFQDKTGSLWIGHVNQGISKLNINRKAFNHFAQGAVIRSLFTDSHNNIWLSADGALQRYNYDHNFNTFYREESKLLGELFTTVPGCFLEDSRSDIWIGSFGEGIKILNGGDLSDVRWLRHDSTKNSILDDRLQALYEDKSGNIWIGNESGLSIYNPTTEQFRHFRHDPENDNSLTHSGVQANCIKQDIYGNLWIGTWGGLTKVIPSNVDINSFEADYDFVQYVHDKDDHNSLSDSKVISLFYDPKIDPDDIYVGTYGGGMNKVQFDNEFNEVTVITYTREQGLSNNVIFSMLSDGKNKIWISTNNGLNCYLVDSDEFIIYDVNDGVQSNQFFWGAAAMGNNGELLFGGINGFNMFKSEEIVRDNTIPQIVLSDLKILNQSVGIGEKINKDIILDRHINNSDKITLSYRENVFTIHFTGLHFAYPESNEYRYKLEGFNDNWIFVDSKQRFASYTNLDAKTYTFKVDASNYDGVWSETPRELIIRVTPPFWKRWWFRILIIAIVGYIGYFIYQRRLEMLRRDKETLEKRIKEGEKEIEAKVKEVEKKQEEIRLRDIEEQEMRFTNLGIAKFSEILSSERDDITELSRVIISELVSRVEGVMGAIYIHKGSSEEKGILELTGSYAIDAKSLDKKHIEPGEGYIGTCFLEGKTIEVNNISPDYSKLTSGLGKVTPLCLYLVPIRQHNNTQGVLEIATLKKLEKYKVQFIEKIGENITSLISLRKASEQMNELLKTSQQQTEELRAQEEEMRQNMEEMYATQEEMQRHAKMAERLQESLKKEKFLFDQLLEYSPVRVNFKDSETKFIKASKSLLKKFGKEKYEEIIGMTEYNFSAKEYAEKVEVDDKELMRTKQSRINFVEHEVRPDGSEIWKNVSKIPMYTEEGTCMGILSIVYDLTDSKLAEIENNYLSKAIDRYKELLDNSAYYLSLNSKGQILSASSKLCDHFGLQPDKILNRPAFAAFIINESNYLPLSKFIEKVIDEKSITVDSYFKTNKQDQAMSQTFVAMQISKNEFEIIMVGTI